MDVWERYEQIEAERIMELIDSIRLIPTDLRDLTDAEILKVLEALRKCEQLPAEFN